ncbi:MAG: hypothetical protein K8R23_10380 [Chthoniobacter sp.]|nr:hypothetical protein [Chthoniobacter sp.]
MLYRTAAALIVVFWLIMAGLLVRQHVGEGDAALREVPVGHVVKLLLMHEQASDLNIYSEKRHLGHLRILPRLPTAERGRRIEFSGNLLTNFPGVERQRMAWDGVWEMEKSLATQRFALDLTLRDSIRKNATAYCTQIVVTPADNLLRWTLQSGDRLLERRQITLDAAGLDSALRELVDPSVLQMVQGQTRAMSPPVIKAHQSTMLIHGERIDTYLVTIEQNGQTLLEADVSQLGQILRAKTLIGYTLMPDDLGP